MSDTQSVLAALILVAATTYVIFRYYRVPRKRGEDAEVKAAPWPFPKLKELGIFAHTRAEKSALDESKSDFCRIAWTMTDLLVATPEAPIPEVWKYPGFGKKEDSAPREVGEEMFKHLNGWLKGELKSVGKNFSDGLAERVVDLLSVTPAVTFAMEHSVPLQIMQAKYLVAVSSEGQVRVIWFAFITDTVKPGAKSGPFILKLLSSNLNALPCDPSLMYTAKRTRETQMCAITSGATDSIRAALLDDKWESLAAL